MSTGTVRKSSSSKKTASGSEIPRKPSYRGVKRKGVETDEKKLTVSKAYAPNRALPTSGTARGTMVALHDTSHEKNAARWTFTASHSRAPGATILGVNAETIDDLIEDINRGLPTTSLTNLSESLGFGRKRVLELTGISERSLMRRLENRQPLTPAESERTARIARVTERAQRMMGPEEGNRWLNGPWPALNHRTPLEYAKTDLGAEAVMDLMGALEEGIFV